MDCGVYFSSEAQLPPVSLYSSGCRAPPAVCSLLTFCLLSFSLHLFLLPVLSGRPVSSLCLSLPIAPRLPPCLRPARCSCSPSFLHAALFSPLLLLPQEPLYGLSVLLRSRYSGPVFCPCRFPAPLSSGPLPSSPVCISWTPSPTSPTCLCSFSGFSSLFTFAYVRLSVIAPSSSVLSPPLSPTSSFSSCASLLPPTPRCPSPPQKGSLGS